MGNLFPANLEGPKPPRRTRTHHINSSIDGSAALVGNPARVLIGRAFAEGSRTIQTERITESSSAQKAAIRVPSATHRSRARVCEDVGRETRGRGEEGVAEPPRLRAVQVHRRGPRLVRARPASPGKRRRPERRLRRLSAIAPPARGLDRSNRRARARSRVFPCFGMWIPPPSRRLSSPASALAAADLPSPFPPNLAASPASRTRTSSRPSTTVPDRRSPARERTSPSARRCGTSSGA